MEDVKVRTAGIEQALGAADRHSLSRLSESSRHIELREAQRKAEHLFHEIEARGLLHGVDGVLQTERQLNQRVYDLAYELFGIKKYWHKRIVRAGRNTLYPYRENPPDLTIEPTDILFLDLGPIFEEWEADFGRTFVLGNDSHKLKLKADVEAAWALGREYFQAHPDITGAELFAHMCQLGSMRGWEYGACHCGHLIGQFPHEKVQGEEVENYIHPDNMKQMRAPDRFGASRDWILEVHFVDRAAEIGGFFEQLLTVEYP